MANYEKRVNSNHLHTTFPPTQSTHIFILFSLKTIDTITFLCYAEAFKLPHSGAAETRSETMSSDSAFAIIVRDNGTKTEIPVDKAEYEKLLQPYKTRSLVDDPPYIGTTSSKLPYRLTLGVSILAIRFRGRRLIGGRRHPSDSTKIPLTMKIVHQKGGEVSFMVTADEYDRVLARFDANREKNYFDAPHFGHDSEGNEYFLMLSQEIFSLSVDS